MAHGARVVIEDSQQCSSLDESANASHTLQTSDRVSN